MKPKYHVRAPQSRAEYSSYYDLRWRILRAPWNQLKGSEQDEYEAEAIHRIAIDNGLIIAAGRLHLISEQSAQIRYMAVEHGYEGRGYGTAILNALEEYAVTHEIKKIILHAREKALHFYLNHGYKIITESHILYGEIKHFRMEREF